MDHVPRERCRYVTAAPQKLHGLIITMTAACVLGASIICVDVLVRMLPGKRNFRIQDSNIFLACSLSLSFGVMVRAEPRAAVAATR